MGRTLITTAVWTGGFSFWHLISVQLSPVLPSCGFSKKPPCHTPSPKISNRSPDAHLFSIHKYLNCLTWPTSLNTSWVLILGPTHFFIIYILIHHLIQHLHFNLSSSTKWWLCLYSTRISKPNESSLHTKHTQGQLISLILPSSSPGLQIWPWPFMYCPDSLSHSVLVHV